jgi:ABC-2 type transport system ATP-binding protein
VSTHVSGANLIEARGLRKSFGAVRALDGFDLVLPPGRILGLIGPNGSGKTTALKTILGLAPPDAGEISVLGLDPRRQRPELMARTGYIADVGTLPRWMRVDQLLTLMAGVHPAFDRTVAERALAATDVRPGAKIGTLSKGMNVQLHLAVLLAARTDLLVLDEPTLGLDILNRQRFYDRLLNEYWNSSRSILVTTHEVREIEHLLTDVVLIHHGRTLLASSMHALAERFTKLAVRRERLADAELLKPLQSRQTPTGLELIYADVDPAHLAPFGTVATPSLPELFVALVEAAERPGTTSASAAA